MNSLCQILPHLCVFLVFPSDVPHQLHPTWSQNGQTIKPAVDVHLSEDGRRGFLSFETPQTKWNSRVYGMWKAEIADLNSDGFHEVILGVWTRVKRHDEPLPARAIWVLEWRDGGLREVWRGSAMALPLKDFWVEENTVWTTECKAETCFKVKNRWTGFGFMPVSRTRDPSRDRPAAW